MEDKFVKQSCTDQGARVSEGLELRLFRITGDLWAQNSLSDPVGRRQKEEPAGPASLLRESVNPPVQTVCAPDKGCDRSCLPLRAWCLAQLCAGADTWVFWAGTVVWNGGGGHRKVVAV